MNRRITFFPKTEKKKKKKIVRTVDFDQVKHAKRLKIKVNSRDALLINRKALTENYRSKKINWLLPCLNIKNSQKLNENRSTFQKTNPRCYWRWHLLALAPNMSVKTRNGILVASVSNCQNVVWIYDWFLALDWIKKKILWPALNGCLWSCHYFWRSKWILFCMYIIIVSPAPKLRKLNRFLSCIFFKLIFTYVFISCL